MAEGSEAMTGPKSGVISADVKKRARSNKHLTDVILFAFILLIFTFFRYHLYREKYFLIQLSV